MQEPAARAHAQVAAGSDAENTSNASHRTLQSLCANVHGQITRFLEERTENPLLQDVQKQTRISLQVAQEALSRYAFEELCMSYNGGKDCLVLLVIYLAAIHVRFTEQPGAETNSNTQVNSDSRSISNEKSQEHFPRSIKAVYIQPAHPFQAVDDFVRSSAKEYRLDLITSAKPMKAAFAEYLEKHTEVKAIFVGTRRTDPHGGPLTHFDPTDRGWPSFTRIHPVIDWHYQEIWAFIRHLKIPYCALYDWGYTSLGGTTDTHPNPKLGMARKDASGQVTGEVTFRPAYELQEDKEERLGRG